jgi:hypothetical protein
VPAIVPAILLVTVPAIVPAILLVTVPAIVLVTVPALRASGATEAAILQPENQFE